MQSFYGEQGYLDLLKDILENGDLVPNRTGVSAYTIPHSMLKFDMKDGFPLFTTKKMAFKAIKVELEFFIKGLTDKKWLQDRGCKIWNEWCNPKKIPSGLTNDERKEFQLNEMDLGKVYGYQWRNFNSSGKDQLKHIIDQLKTNPTNRQLVCSAWCPTEIEEQALPPCHILWHVFVVKNKLHLCWFQRSVDSFLGLSFNVASYALLLHLIAKETGYEPGILTGFLSNCHIYENHVEAVKTQLSRTPLKFPEIEITNFKSIYDWTYEDVIVKNYESYPAIKADIAV